MFDFESLQHTIQLWRQQGYSSYDLYMYIWRATDFQLINAMTTASMIIEHKDSTQDSYKELLRDYATYRRFFGRMTTNCPPVDEYHQPLLRRHIQDATRKVEEFAMLLSL